MKIKAEIDGRTAAISFIRPDGRHVSKTIAVDVLCNILQKREANAAELVLVPPGLRIHATLGPKLLVGFEMYESKQRINFRINRGGNAVDVVYNVVLPHNMSFVEYSHNENEDGSYVFRRFFQYALKVPFYGLDTPLFMWPFPNTYGDGACCTGQTVFPPCKSIRETASAPNLFHSGTYNSDLNSNRFTAWTPEGHTSTISTTQSLWEYLAHDTAPKPFPYHVLKPQFTVRDMFKNAGYAEVC